MCLGKSARQNACAGQNQYQFNGIERVEELGVNLDLALFRSFDPAVSRWWQVDPLAELMPDLNPYRVGLNNPIVNADPLGLFETRTEARDFKKEHGIKGRVRRDGDSYYIQERGDGGGQYAYGGVAAGYGTSEAATVRGYRISEVGADAALEMEKNNPDIVFMNSFREQAYIWGLKLGFALPSARIVTVSKTVTTVASQVAEGAGQGFKSFSAFKNAMGTAGKGNAWHHIVEQHADNIAKFGAESIHNSSNLIKLPSGAGSIHAKVTGYYNSLMPGTGMRVRDYVKTLSYEQQYQFGIEVLKRFGWLP